jgi:hypothetical protein
MNWTVACFCGNVYTAPPNRCDECGCTFGESAPGPTASATHVHALSPTELAPSDAPIRVLPRGDLHRSGAARAR